MSDELHDQYVFQLEGMLETAVFILECVNKSKTFPIRGTDAGTSLQMEAMLEGYEEFKKFWNDETGGVKSNEWFGNAKCLNIDLAP